MSTITRTAERHCFRQPDGLKLGIHTICTTVKLPTATARGWFEMEIKSLDEHAEGMLRAEMVDGKLTLVDYDGVHALSFDVADILRENGIEVDE